MTQKFRLLRLAAVTACVLLAFPTNSGARECDQDYVNCYYACSIGWGSGATWCCYDKYRACTVIDTQLSILPELT